MHLPAAHRFVPAALAIGLLAALPVTGSVAMSTSRLPAASSPVKAVRLLVRPFYDGRYHFSTCSTLSPRRSSASACPVTARLAVRLRQPRTIGSGLALCRCQSPARSVRLRQISSNGRVARVNAHWDFGPDSYTSTFVVLHGLGGWRVDDEYCAGRPRTNLYGLQSDVPCH